MTSNRFLHRLLPLCLWLVVIFSLSTHLGSATNTTSAISRFIQAVAPDVFARLSAAQLDAIDFGIRKTAHFTEYAILAILFFRWYRTCRPRVAHSAAALAWGSATLYAASDEFHQVFVSGRTPKVGDVMIDSAGAFTAMLAAAWIVRRCTQSRTAATSSSEPLLGARREEA